MKNHNFKFFITFFFVIVFSSMLLNLESNTKDSVSTDIVDVTKVGKSVKQVRLPHEKHEDAGVKCIACHHKEGNDDRIKKCAACHEGEDGKELSHSLCIDCHQEKKEGPTACDDCHKY